MRACDQALAPFHVSHASPDGERHRYSHPRCAASYSLRHPRRKDPPSLLTGARAPPPGEVTGGRGRGNALETHVDDQRGCVGFRAPTWVSPTEVPLLRRRCLWPHAAMRSEWHAITPSPPAPPMARALSRAGLASSLVARLGSRSTPALAETPRCPCAPRPLDSTPRYARYRFAKGSCPRH